MRPFSKVETRHSCYYSPSALNQLIIRVTDKSNNFYIGAKIEFENKTQQYFIDTNAYVEVVDNPFDDVLNQVLQLLN